MKELQFDQSFLAQSETRIHTQHKIQLPNHF